MARAVRKSGMKEVPLSEVKDDRSRYLPGILAVAFSAVLIALQCGLLLGLFSITSIPIDHTRADIWVGSPQVLSVDLGRPIPQSYLSRIAGDRRVAVVESYYQAFANWTKPDGGSDLCIVIGCDLNDGNLGAAANNPHPCGTTSLIFPRNLHASPQTALTSDALPCKLGCARAPRRVRLAALEWRPPPTRRVRR